MLRFLPVWGGCHEGRWIMNRIILGTMAGLLLFAWQAAPGFTAPAKNGCLMCHTNDKMMKMLYKPPAVTAGEGEG